MRSCHTARCDAMRVIASIAGLGILLFLGSCNSTRIECPPLVNYTATQQKKLAGELRQLSSDAMVSQAVVDYHKLRNACRAIDEAHR